MMDSATAFILGFWIFATVGYYCDFQLYLRGHNTVFFSHKTEEEERIREAQIRLLEKQAGIEHEAQ